MIPDTDGILTRSDLSDPLRRKLREKERSLHRQCRKIWTFTNPNEERFIFGQFWRNRDDIIVTIASYVEGVGWIPPFDLVV